MALTSTGSSTSVPLRGYVLEYPQFPWLPTLSVTLSNATLIVSWPAPAEGWVLEWTNTLSQRRRG